MVTSCERREKREGGRERKRENFANVSAESLGGRSEERGRGGNEDEIVWRISRGGGEKNPRKLVVAASITGEKETLVFGERGN